MMRIDVTGLRATIQDRGRFGHLRDGVPPSGPADPSAFAAAQALVGNEAGAAVIEIVGGPFSFRSDDPRIVAVTGRDVALRGRDLMPGWTAAFARPGETFTVVCGERSRFAYLAVSGGIATETILGSRSAYLPAGIGRPLRAGEALPLVSAPVDTASLAMSTYCRIALRLSTQLKRTGMPSSAQLSSASACFAEPPGHPTISS